MNNFQDPANKNQKIITKSETFFVSDSLKDLVTPEDLVFDASKKEEIDASKFDFVSYSKEKSCIVLKSGESSVGKILENSNNPEFCLSVSFLGKVWILSTETLEILKEKNFYYVTMSVRSILENI